MLAIDRERHFIRTVPFSGYLRSEFPNAADDLFVYYHRDNNVWVICRWADKGKGLCEEMLILEGLDEFNRGHVRELHFMLHPSRHDAYKQWARAQVAGDRAWRRFMDDELMDTNERRSYHEKRSGHNQGNPDWMHFA